MRSGCAYRHLGGASFVQYSAKTMRTCPMCWLKLPVLRVVSSPGAQSAFEPPRESEGVRR